MKITTFKAIFMALFTVASAGQMAAASGTTAQELLNWQLFDAVENKKVFSLFKAVENKGSVEVQQLIANVNAIGNEWNGLDTPLIRAVENGRVDIVPVLIAAGANVNAQSKSGRTPLMAAIRNMPMITTFNERIKLVSDLILAGADVNAQDEDGHTALMVAACSPYSNLRQESIMLLLLLEAGADINIQGKDGRTALTFAEHSEAFYSWEEEEFSSIRLLAKIKTLDFPATYHAIDQAIKREKTRDCWSREERLLKVLEIVRAEELARNNR
jgi:hypothetical protein